MGLRWQRTMRVVACNQGINRSESRMFFLRTGQLPCERAAEQTEVRETTTDKWFEKDRSRAWPKYRRTNSDIGFGVSALTLGLA